MQDKLQAASNGRVLLWQIIIGVLFLIFIGIRLINLQTTLIWSDDISTLPSLTFTPWSQLPQVTYEQLTHITGPIFPTFLDGVLINLFGASILALRLPTLIVSVFGFILLWRVLKQLFPYDRWAQWLPCVLYTFSIPAVIYAQQIQPTVYYFLATATQLTVFIPFYRTSYNDPLLRRRMLLFVGVSTLAFFLNYVSILVTAIFGALWCIRLYDDVRRKRLKRRDGMRHFIIFAVLHLVLMMLILNIPFEGDHGGHPGRSYFLSYYFLNPIEFVQRSYDMISYHFNYVFDPALYKPLGANLLSLPFVILVLWGIRVFLRSSRLHILYALITLFALYVVSTLAYYPYGGVRHSFTFAPLLYVFAGYAVASFNHKRRVLLVGGLVAYMLICWFLWGINLYELRRTRIDVNAIVKAANEYDTGYVVGYSDMYEILQLQESINGDVLANAEITLVRLPFLQRLESLNLNTPFLLTSYRTAINPTWNNPVGTDAIDIPYNSDAFTITPLVLDTGRIAPDDLDAQSIYSPMNGFFLYYIEPK